MFKDGRYINAGTNEFYRYGHKAVEMIQAGLVANEKGYCSIPANGGKYYTFGTSEGKYGEFAKYKDTFLSVNRGGYIYAKVGTDKHAAYVEMLNGMIDAMNAENEARVRALQDDEDEE